MKKFRRVIFVCAVLWLVSLAACSSPPAQQQGGNLGNDPWILERMAGAPVIPGRDVTLQFGADGNLGGNASCNSYFAQYQVDGRALVIGQPGSTQMACVEEELMQQESRFLSLLPFVRSYAVEGNNLTLLDGDGQPLLEFRQ